MKEDILDKYALNRLSEKDKAWLKQALEKNPSFQKELDLHADIVKGLEILMEQLFEVAIEEIPAFNTLDLKANIEQVDAELDLEGFFSKALVEEKTAEEVLEVIEEKAEEILEVIEEKAEEKVLETTETIEEEALEEALIENIKAQGEQELKTTIKTVDKKLEVEGFFEKQQAEPSTVSPTSTPATASPTPIFRLLKITAAAASILLVLTFGWQYLGGGAVDSTSSVSEMAAVSIEHFPNALSQQVKMELSEKGFAGNPEEEALQQLLAAMNAYDAKDYNKASVALRSLLETEVDETYKNQVQLYLAISYLQLEQPQNAYPPLHSITKSNSPLKETSMWYLAMAYIKDNNPNSAKTQLEQLKNSPEYGQRANEMLLDRFAVRR